MDLFPIDRSAGEAEQGRHPADDSSLPVSWMWQDLPGDGFMNIEYIIRGL